MRNDIKLKLLTTNEVAMLHEKCLHVLIHKGVSVEYPTALKILDKAGARVDHDTQMVRFPRDIIDAALKSAPKSFTVMGSDQKYDFELPHPTGSYYTCTCVQSMRYHDPDTNRFVDVTSERLAEWIQLASRLDHIDKIAIQTATDVPPETADVHSLSILLQNTDKPLMVLPYCLETVEYQFELMLARAGSTQALRERPMLYMYPTSLSPLKFKPVDMEEMIQSCRYGVPMVANSLAITGGTAPMTIAGTALLAGVEIMAMLVMAQLMAPGIPVIPSVYTTSMEMASGNALLNNAESMLGRATASQFIKEAFGLPVETFSYMTDAYVSDGQALLEKSLMPALLHLSGCDIQYGAGRLGGSTYASPIQLIIDDQVTQIVQRCTDGVAVGDDDLAMEEIMNIEPGGDFMSSEHTLRHCRNLIRPDLFVPTAIDDWEAEGRKDLYQRAVEKYRELKKDLAPPPLPAEVRKEMDRITRHADKHLAG
ncbi:MAG: trimethylamine methyltransferase family protein [Deltaproteobacteria bacterium]|nr:trimethylamine methyltransferase family protein [Deltaproteobacteria bacterium]